MDTIGLSCPGCGSSDVLFDPKSRILTCKQCGKKQTYARATLNKNSKVLYAGQNAVNFFSDGKYYDAKHFAQEVLDISMDNASALFIMAYYDEFVEGRNGAMRLFFNQIIDVALEYDELKTLRQLILASAYRLADYEEKIIELVAKNMQGEEDIPELQDFFDRICLYFISKRTSTVFFNMNLIEMYKDLAEHCGIPKTCYALLKAIESNPDSPYTDNSFYMKAKAEYFYNHFVLPVGEIIEKMSENEYKEKFLSVFNTKKQKYANDMTQH